MCAAIRVGETITTAGVLLVLCFIATSYVVDAGGWEINCSKVNLGSGNPYSCAEDAPAKGGVKSWLCFQYAASGAHRIRCTLAKQGETTPKPLECVFNPGVAKEELILQPGVYKYSKAQEALKACYPANGLILKSLYASLKGLDKAAMSKTNVDLMEAGVKPTADSDSLI